MSNAPSAEPATDAVAPAAVARSAPRAQSAAAAPRAAASVPVTATVPAVPSAPAAVPIATAEAAPPAPAPDTAAPVEAPVPARVATEAGNDLAPVAGAAGLGALLIAGGAVAYRRRRRNDEAFGEEDRIDVGATTRVIDTPVAPAPAPSYAPPRAAPAMPRTSEERAVPAGFDVSRFSPRVQAAYAGPTADNPSSSLKSRLKRARFFNQQERAQASAARPGTTAPASASRYGEFAMGRPAGSKPGFRPAFQN